MRWPDPRPNPRSRELTQIFLSSTNVVMNYTEIEGKVREATNDDPWGPTGPLMQELAHATFTYEHFPEVMSMLWKRMLQENKTNWRRTYKVSVFSSIPRAIRATINVPFFHPPLPPESPPAELFGAKWLRTGRDQFP